jgi:hypothetical protein
MAERLRREADPNVANHSTASSCLVKPPARRSEGIRFVLQQSPASYLDPGLAPSSIHPDLGLISDRKQRALAMLMN